MANYRQLREIKKAFLREDIPELVASLSSMPLKNAISLVISVVYSPEEAIRAKAVTVFGILMNRLAQFDMELARQIMRRLMWSLNDESGGIGWGAPEAMAEAMALNEGLAQEYAHMLLSYIWEEGNYLEYLPLRRSALRGIARLACVRPLLLKGLNAVELLTGYLNDEDNESKEMAMKGLSCLMHTP